MSTMQSVLSKLVISAVCWVAMASSAYASDPLKVTAVYATSSGHAVIHYTVQNVSGRPISIDEAQLPWATVWTVQTVLAYRGSRTVIPRLPIIDDAPVSMDKTLGANEEITGDSRLDGYINDFSKANATSDIVVFWFYEPKSSNRKPLGQYSGSFVIPTSMKRGK